MAAKKLTKPEKMVQDQMLALLEWAGEQRGRWCDIGQLESTKEAARLLEAGRGVIETRQPQNQYRLKPTPRGVNRGRRSRR